LRGKREEKEGEEVKKMLNPPEEMEEEPKNNLKAKKMKQKALKEGDHKGEVQPGKFSPVNGQPLPYGKRFTSETAREARAKRTNIDRERRSIAQAFMKNMSELHEMRDRNGKIVQKTGAEIIAESIMVACNKGNANAMNIALGLMGEKPAEKIAISAPNADVIRNVEEALLGDAK
jgi:hypothetical protein